MPKRPGLNQIVGVVNCVIRLLTSTEDLSIVRLELSIPSIRTFLFALNLFPLSLTQLGCLKTEFRCEDGTCLPDEMHCDGKLDCPGGRGEDELACTTLEMTCSASMFFCGPLDGDCIELLKVCDGYLDCFVSGTDEANCRKF